MLHTGYSGQSCTPNPRRQRNRRQTRPCSPRIQYNAKPKSAASRSCIALRLVRWSFWSAQHRASNDAHPMGSTRPGPIVAIGFRTRRRRHRCRSNYSPPGKARKMEPDPHLVPYLVKWQAPAVKWNPSSNGVHLLYGPLRHSPRWRPGRSLCHG